jgi:SAM-dependent methyltransferase
MIDSLHQRLVFRRRTLVLTEHLVEWIPPSARILDVGCGDGTIDRLLKEHRADVSIEGIDTLIRPNAQVLVRSFDGITIPYTDGTFDVVMFVDVLHHTLDPRPLLREAARVGATVLIKDHLREGFLANTILRLMDWVGNARYGIALPYNYLSRSEWQAAFVDTGLQPREMKTKLDLYPAPLSWCFERELHFMALCDSRGSSCSKPDLRARKIQGTMPSLAV